MPTLIKLFHIEGVMINDNNEIISIETFEVGKNYNALIFTRKKD